MSVTPGSPTSCTQMRAFLPLAVVAADEPAGDMGQVTRD